MNLMTKEIYFVILDFSLININALTMLLALNRLLYAKISQRTFKIINEWAQFNAKIPIILLMPVRSTFNNDWSAPPNPST